MSARSMVIRSFVLVVVVSAVLSQAGLLQPFIREASADPIQNARTERIGNYDFQMTTEPKNPVQGTPVKIIMRVATVDGSDLVDVPIVVRIMDSDGKLLQETKPLVLPAGHYSYTVTFDSPGRKTIYFDLTDNEFTGQTLTFTFFINVASVYDFLYIMIPSIAAVAIFLVVLRYIRKRRTSFKSADASV